MGLALSGLASGFDWKSIVDQLIEVSRTPQNRMRTEKSGLASKTSALNEIKSLLANLKTSASSLGSEEALLKKTATFQDASTNWTASATADAPAGDYEFELLSLATTSKLVGAGGLVDPLNSADLISDISVGRTITGGTFTVNGKPISFTTADSLDSVLSKVVAETGGEVVASYNSGTDRIDLFNTNGNPIILGASNDTSNFLQAMRLTSGGVSVSSSAPALSAPKVNVPINSAGLSGWAALPSDTYSFKINGTAVGYDPTTDTLQDLLKKINSSGAGVTATYDPSSGGFLLRSQTTGNVGISISDDTTNLFGNLKLTSGTGAALTSGADAVFTINGSGNLTSRSNILDETAHGIAGLTVTANGVGIEKVTVAGDTTASKKALEDFISKYNTVQTTIDRYTRVTTTGDKVTAAVLAGNREVGEISRELRKLLYVTGTDENDDSLTGTVKRLSDIGIQFAGIENTISISNASLLESKLLTATNDISAYFSSPNGGLSARLDSFLDRLVSDSGTAQGSLKTQLDSIDKQNKSLDSQIENFERKLASQRSLLESSFIAMESAQANYQQQSSYLAQTFSSKSK